MRFHPSDDQRLFQESLRSFLERECTADQVRASWEGETGRSAERWAKLAEMGLLGVLVPEAHGGLGLDEVALSPLLEETGRVALPEPVVETAAVAVPLLVDCGDESLAASWLPRVASGDATISVGLAANPVVTDAHVADLLLMQHGDELHAIDPTGVTLAAQPGNDPSRRLFSVGWTPSEATRVAAGDDGRRLLADAFDHAALGAAAQQLGIAQKLVELAVAYACERHQFGQPIGSFQAVKHLLANVAVRIEFARPVVYRAAWSVAQKSPHRSIHVSHAKSAASEAAVLAAKTALQVHGAMGYTWEVDLHIWMKRAWALEAAWGTGIEHRRRIAEAVLDGDARAGFGFEAK